jgi:hypothetical protein
VKLVEIVTDENGNATELIVEHDTAGEIKKPSGTIHWVAETEVYFISYSLLKSHQALCNSNQNFKISIY